MTIPTRVLKYCLCVLLLASLSAQGYAQIPGTAPAEEATANQAGRWRIDPWGFAKVGDGQVNGPLLSAISGGGATGGVRNLTQAPDGTYYLLAGQKQSSLRIYALHQGRIFTLAGTGMEGFRDGPAEQAMFSAQQPGHYNLRWELQADDAGRLYLSDFGNARIRRIARKEDKSWHVETVAGGGKRKLKEGESASALEVDLQMPTGPHFARASDDLLWIIGFGHLYQLEVKTGALTRKPWLATPIDLPRSAVVYQAAGDGLGNGYFVTEFGGGACEYWRITPEGGIVHLAGDRTGHPSRSPYAGPPRETFFWTVANLIAPPRDRYIYVNAGDHNIPRRLAVDGSEPVTALHADGLWRPCHSAPKTSSFWSTTVAPKMEDKLGKHLVELFWLLGCDRQGAIYGVPHAWGEALRIPTGIYRLAPDQPATK